MKLILKYILWFPWDMDSSGFGFNSSFELKPKQRKERLYQYVLGSCPCSLRKWGTGSLQRLPGLRIGVGGKWGWGGHPWSLPFFHLLHCWGKTRAETFLGMPPKSLLAPSLRCSPLGVSSLTARAWEHHIQVVGSSGAECGCWPWCGMVTPSNLLLKTSTASPLAHCALQWAAQCLKRISHRFIMLFSVRQQLTPARYSWGSNASHSSSGAPRSLGYFAKHKRQGNRAMVKSRESLMAHQWILVKYLGGRSLEKMSWCPCERYWLTGHHQADIRSKNAELHS